ncbi:hypothetical protein BJ166DRAFT_179680 [Pestalotiopsis sp. NC0098]|nr:hypothetical protein BJ166DRAFT_179680 [Pestalotiopsis sp. NC0098]
MFVGNSAGDGLPDRATRRRIAPWAGRCAALLSAPSEEKKGCGGNLYCLRPRLSSPQLFSLSAGCRHRGELRRRGVLYSGSWMGLSEVSLPLLHNDQMPLCVLTPKPARNGPLGWFMVSREPGVQQHFWPSIKLIFILPLKTLAPKTNRTLLSNITHLRDSGTLRLSLLSRFQRGPTRQNKTKQKRPWAFLLYFVFPVGFPATEWSKRSGPLKCLVSPCRSLARNTSRLPETHVGPMYCVG